MDERNEQRTGVRNQQTARAGEYFVAAELNRRGAYAVTFAGNMPKIDILASNRDRTRTLSIQVKTRRSGSWHSSTDHGHQCQFNPDETCFWIFVDLKNEEAHPDYYIVPEWWIRNNIYETHQGYLAKHGGHRAVNQDSKHHAIELKHIQTWKDRWDLLNLF